jgi:hypothetical protein
VDLIVPHKIKKSELGGIISDEAQKVLEKVKETSELAPRISAPNLPARTTLHKYYATTDQGARRLLFFYRRAAPVQPPLRDAKPANPVAAQQPPPVRWVLLFYRDKNDSVGKNMSAKNSDFIKQLSKNMAAAFDDLNNSKAGDQRFDVV